MEPTLEQEDEVLVRNLRPEDLEAVITLDGRILGHARPEYFRMKLDQNLAETGIKVSLAAELDGHLGGFLLARIYYGEFGLVEPSAILDTIGVDPGRQGQGVGRAMLAQLSRNLRGLQVHRLRTEVDWQDASLLNFFRREGFEPAPRLCLDLDVEAHCRAGDSLP